MFRLGAAIGFVAAGLTSLSGRVVAWDYDGHRLVALLALRTLPTNFPAFALAPDAVERVAFLSGEPDRWRNSPDLSFAHLNKPDHFFDLDELPLYGLTMEGLSPFRYEAEDQLAAGRAAHAGQFPAETGKDPDRTRGRIGFLPWTIVEHEGRLKSGFSSLREFEQAGTPAELSNVRQNLLYTMGVMSHYVGDAVQPLHSTRHYNGWVGENPAGFTTNKTFHSWIDGGFLARLNLDAAGLASRLRPARKLAADSGAVRGAGRTNLFPQVLSLLQRSHEQVRPLYQLDRDGRLSARGEPPAEGREFMVRQLLEGAQFLGDLWVTAWEDAPPDFYLRGQLARRHTGRAEDESRTKPTGTKP